MIRAVLDTNVIISSIFWRGNPYNILKEGISGSFTMVSSSQIIDEIVDKLRNKFKFPETELQILIEILLKYCEIIITKSKFDAVTDKKDNKIVECAYDGGADYITSGDDHLLKLKEFKGIKIATPKEFLEILKKEKSNSPKPK